MLSLLPVSNSSVIIHLILDCLTIMFIACGERVFVEDGIVIDLSLHTNCNWLEIQTQENRILAFSLLEGTFEQLEEFLTVIYIYYYNN